MTASAKITDEQVRRYREDGAIALKGVLALAWLELLELGVERNIRNPGPMGLQSWPESQGTSNRFMASPGDYWQDYCNFEAIPEFRRALYDSPIADIAARLLGSGNVWLFYDQIFLKQGPSRPTPWHQDSPYFLVTGAQIATIWIPFATLPLGEALEFVAGSHLGTMYDGSRFDERDLTAPYYGGGHLPRLPDIEKEREKWPILSWPLERGDVLVFHPNTLHAGGAVPEGKQRRAFAARLYGDDAVYVERPGRPAPPFPGVAEKLKPGDPLRHPCFPRLRPAPQA